MPCRLVGAKPSSEPMMEYSNDGILLIGPLGINFSEILIEINTFSFNKMHLIMSSAKWRLFRLGLNELTLQKSDLESRLKLETHSLSCPNFKSSHCNSCGRLIYKLIAGTWLKYRWDNFHSGRKTISLPSFLCGPLPITPFKHVIMCQNLTEIDPMLLASGRFRSGSSTLCYDTEAKCHFDKIFITDCTGHCHN